VNAITDQPVAAGAAVPFQIRVENPPAEAVDLEATFASFGETSMAGGPAHVSPPSSTHDELLLDEPLDPAHELIDPSHSTTTSSIGGADGLRLTTG